MGAEPTHTLSLTWGPTTLVPGCAAPNPASRGNGSPSVGLMISRIVAAHSNSNEKRAISVTDAVYVT